MNLYLFLSLHMHEAWPWLCSFHFISVYRLLFSHFSVVAEMLSGPRLLLGNRTMENLCVFVCVGLKQRVQLYLFPKLCIASTARANVSRSVFFPFVRCVQRLKWDDWNDFQEISISTVCVELCGGFNFEGGHFVLHRMSFTGLSFLSNAFKLTGKSFEKVQICYYFRSI